MEVKLLPRQGELYVLARSNDRVAKERACVGANSKNSGARLKELQQMAPARDALLLKLGAAKSQYPSGWRLVKIEVGQDGTLSFCLRKDKLREIRQREGRYLLRSNLGSENPRVATVLHSVQRPLQAQEVSLRIVQHVFGDGVVRRAVVT